MDPLGFLESIKDTKEYRNQIVHIRHIPQRSALYSEVEPPVGGEIGEALSRLGINKFYSHQAQAIEAVRGGESIVVVTSTASGKTLCYNVPVIEALEKDPGSRALYIYPTKALAQDQLGKLRQYGISRIKAATYDGDTPRSERPFIKASANIVLTNPDMLHVGILPYHTTWSEFFRNLKYVVIDEVHMYRGVFGAHVANIMRRLRRIAAYYGSSPQFVCASATVKNPGSLVRDLTGVDAQVIDIDGSPSGEKVFVFWNPPFISEKGERRSANSEAVNLFTELVESGTRTIVFTKARKTAELILRYTVQQLRDDESPYADKVMSYRAGYTPAERREIERRLFSGELIGVASTTALEVGVDIGGLDAVILTGYPGTIASTWQQVGRAGRGRSKSLAVLVAQDNPMDQYLMRSPEYFFTSGHERAVVDAQNPYVLADHLLCAAYELPIEEDEVDSLFGERAWEVLGVLTDVDQLSYRGKWFWIGTDYPAGKINIRSASNVNYSIMSVERGGQLLGTVDSKRVFDTVHPGAVYLHAGESYVVTKLDIPNRTAFVERSEVSYYTTPGSKTHITVEEEVYGKEIGQLDLHFGDVSVTNQVTHFYRKRLFSDEVMEKVDLNLPETTLSTEAVWLALPEDLVNTTIDEGFDLPGSIHAVEHAAIGILPLFALCDRDDIGGVSHPEHPDTQGRAAIFIYDGHSGGVGIARTAYDMIGDLLAATLKTIDECKCEGGCPSCVQSPKCGNNNEPLDKRGAEFILRELVDSISKAQA